MIRSPHFDDIYFSAENGLAETQHVFLQSNNLPQAWVNRETFTICETGFGTGLNILAAWKLFEETAATGQKLDLVSVEKYPLAPDDMRQALLLWKNELGEKLERLLTCYPLRVPGFHRLYLTPSVRLTLIFDDVNEALPQLVAPGGIDVWFLDGFAPAKNPQMWTEEIFRNMARLSAPGATAATFTAAGSVRRGLAAAGFSVEKISGYGRKRDMTRAVFPRGSPLLPMAKPKTIAIVGGGLAGTACARSLKREGFSPVIFEREKSLSPGASGNPIGIFNPRFSVHRTPESDFYTAGFSSLIQVLKDLQRHEHDLSYNPCGSLHLVISEEKQKRFEGALSRWGWHTDHCRFLDKEQASAQAGISLAMEALFLPDSGIVSPEKLCRAYASDVEIRYETPFIPDLENAFDAVILANGIAAKDHPGFHDLPIHTVRGQISFLQETGISKNLRSNLCYGGYLSPAVQGAHAAGATFQPWRTDTDVTDEDHRDIMAKIHENIPSLREGFKITGGRSALRCASRHRFPIIGKCTENVYVSTAHGSHGLLSTIAGAFWISDMISGSVGSLSQSTVAVLNPARGKKHVSQR